jgi:hypothetical protein
MLTPEREQEIRTLLHERRFSLGGIDEVYNKVMDLLAEIDRLRGAANKEDDYIEYLQTTYKHCIEFQVTLQNECDKLKQDMHLVVSDAGKDLIKERDDAKLAIEMLRAELHCAKAELKIDPYISKAKHLEIVKERDDLHAELKALKESKDYNSIKFEDLLYQLELVYKDRDILLVKNEKFRCRIKNLRLALEGYCYLEPRKRNDASDALDEDSKYDST